MWYAYIIRCSDDKLYTGITTNIKRRLSEHNAGRGSRFTRFRKPVELVYSQEMPGRSQALQREAQIKKLSRIEKLEMVRSCGISIQHKNLNISRKETV